MPAPSDETTRPAWAERERADLVQVADEHLVSVLAAMAGDAARAHPDQARAVEALVADQARVLVVQATGWGKSAVYWAATSAIRALGGGPTLVVSPLLALMRDQLTAAERAGLRAVTINSTNVDDWDGILADIGAGTVDVLLVSPERLANPGFARRLPTLIAGAGLIVIDEAHCISDWGFDFRPDYQRLSKVLTSAPGTPVLATTATANARVTADVATQLGDATVVLRGGLARSSLRLSVVDGLGPLERYAWVDTALATLPGSGIIYVPTVAETERLAGYLRLARPHRRRLLGPARPRGAGTGRAEVARQRAQGRRRDVGARHGLRQTRSGLLRARGLTRLSRRLLPTGRPGGARHRQRRRRAAPGRDRRAHLGVLRHRGGARPGQRRDRCSTRSTARPASR